MPPAPSLLLIAAALAPLAARAQQAAHALQIVAPASGRREALAVGPGLEQLRALGEVEVVACVGPYHSGKSFMLNNLLGLAHPGQDGFAVGETIDATTSGIWAWGTPSPSPGAPATLFVDVEGVGSRNVTSDYDAKLFAIAAVLSSHIIMNSMSVLTAEAADQLEVLAHKTQLFYFNAVRRSAHRATQAGRADVFDASRPSLGFPSLTWTLQSFSLDLGGLNATSYVRSMVAGSRKSDELEDATVSSGFTALFRPTGFVLPPPTETTRDLRRLRHLEQSQLDDEYLTEVAALRTHIAQELATTRAVREATRAAQIALEAPAGADGASGDAAGAAAGAAGAAAAASASASAEDASALVAASPPASPASCTYGDCAAIARAASAGAREALKPENSMLSLARPRTGSDIADLITQLVAAANEGGMPRVPSSWAQLIKQQAGAAREAAVADAARRMAYLHAPERPLSGADFDAGLRREHAAAASLFGHLVAGLSGAAVADELAALQRTLAGAVEGERAKQQQLIRAHCDREAAAYRAAFAAFAAELHVPQPLAAFRRAVAARKDAELARFRARVQAAYGEPDTSANVQDLRRSFDAVQIEREGANRAALEKETDAVKARFKDAFRAFLDGFALPEPSAALSAAAEARRAADEARFRAEAARLHGEPDAKSAAELEAFFGSAMAARLEANRLALERALGAARARGAAACAERARGAVAALAAASASASADHGGDRDAPVKFSAMAATLASSTQAGLAAFADAAAVAREEPAFRGAQALVREACAADFEASHARPNVARLQAFVLRAADACLGGARAVLANLPLPADDAPLALAKKAASAAGVDCLRPRLADFEGEPAAREALARLRADVGFELADLSERNDAAVTRIFRRPLERAFDRVQREARASALPGLPGWLAARAAAVAAEEVQAAIDDGLTGGHQQPSADMLRRAIGAWCEGRGSSPHPARLIADADASARAGLVVAAVLGGGLVLAMLVRK